MSGTRRRPGSLFASMMVLVAILIAVLGIAPSSVFANNIQPYKIIPNSDFVSAGYGGMRSNGRGTVQINGISGTVTQALLYWHGPTNSSNTNANASVSFAGTTITGTNIGLSSDNCWQFTNSQAYRADVTSLVTGNGSYALDGFVKSGGIEVNGVSLIVFFNDGNDANNRDIVLFDGNDSNADNSFDAPGWNVTLSGITYSSGNASFQLHVSDGQQGSAFEDAAVRLNSSSLVGQGQVFSGNSVPNGASAGRTSGGLWDIKSFDVTGALTPGANTLQLSSGFVSDCLSLVAAIIDLPAGAAPPTFPALPDETVRGNPAQVYAVQRPTPNHVVTPGSVVSYEVVVKNLGRGSAKTAYVTMPLTGAAEVLSATFSRSSAWVTEVTASSLKFETGPIGSRTDVVTATIRLAVKPGAAAGSTLTDRLTVSWRDGVGGGSSFSNLPILVVGAAPDNRATYTLAVDANSVSAGTPFVFSSGIFAPKEPIGTWYNTADGGVEAGPTFYAEDDGSLAVRLDSSDLDPGNYSFVFYGNWTEFTGVAPFSVK